MEGFIITLFVFVFSTLLYIKPVELLLRKYVLPAPGECGEDSENFYLRVYGMATGDKGSSYFTKIYFPACPGYVETSRMLVESGLCLSLEKEMDNVSGGLYTPACCQGEVLLKRLMASGTEFEGKFVKNYASVEGSPSEKKDA